MGDFYDLAQMRGAEVRTLRSQLAEADREIKALRDELDYVHAELDDVTRQLERLETSCAPTSAVEG